MSYDITKAFKETVRRQDMQSDRQLLVVDARTSACKQTHNTTLQSTWPASESTTIKNNLTNYPTFN